MALQNKQSYIQAYRNRKGFKIEDRGDYAVIYRVSSPLDRKPFKKAIKKVYFSNDVVTRKKEISPVKSTATKKLSSYDKRVQSSKRRLSNLKKGTFAYERESQYLRKLQGLPYEKVTVKAISKQKKSYPSKKIQTATLKTPVYTVQSNISKSIQPLKEKKVGNITYYRDSKTGKLVKRELTGVEKRAIRLEKAEADVQAQKERRFKELGIARDITKSEWNPKEIAKGLGRAPIETFTGIFTIGGRLGLAADALANRRFKALKTAAKGTPKAILSNFVTKRPDGSYTITPGNVLNIALTAVAVKSIQSQTATRIGFNKQMANAKVKAAKVKVTKVNPKQVKVTTTGKLKLPKVKYAGKTLKAKTVPFKETKIVAKGAKPSAYSAKTVTKFRIPARGTKTKIKTAKARIKAKTTVKKPIEGTVGKKAVTKTAGVIKVRKGLAVRKAKFATITKGKETITITRARQINTLAKTKISNLKNPSKNVKTFDLQTYSKVIPKAKLSARLKSSLRSINSKLKSGKLTKTQIRNLKQNKLTIQKAIKKLPKIKGKKAQIAIGRDRGLGTGARQRPIADNVDDIIRDMNSKLSSLKTTKPKIKTPTKTIDIRSVNIDTIIPAARVALLPKLVVPIVPIPSIDVKGVSLIQGKTVTKPALKVQTKEGTIARPTPSDIVTVKAPAKVEPITEPTPKTINEAKTNPVVNNFFTPAATSIFNIINNQFIPFAGGLPFTLPTPKGNLFSIPGMKLPRKINYKYNADLFSRIWGVKATAKERERLLRKGRIFTGLEARKLI